MLELMAGQDVHQGDRHLGRSTLRRAVQVGKPGLCLYNGVVACSIYPRTVGRDFRVNRTRVQLVDGLEIKAQPLGVAGLEADEHDVSSSDQLLRDPSSVWMLQVDAYRLLSSVHAGEVRGQASF